jgi:hypothetical protein
VERVVAMMMRGGRPVTGRQAQLAGLDARQARGLALLHPKAGLHKYVDESCLRRVRVGWCSVSSSVTYAVLHLPSPKADLRVQRPCDAVRCTYPRSSLPQSTGSVWRRKWSSVKRPCGEITYRPELAELSVRAAWALLSTARAHSPLACAGHAQSEHRQPSNTVDDHSRMLLVPFVLPSHASPPHGLSSSNAQQLLTVAHSMVYGHAHHRRV